MSSVQNLQMKTGGELWAVNEDGKLVFSHTAFIAFDGETACYASTPARVGDVDLKAVLETAQPIPREHIYPLEDSGLTRLNLPTDAPEVYIKTPDLTSYNPEKGELLAELLLQEAKIYEILGENPHPNVVQPLGCVVSDDGRITAHALARYKGRLLADCARDPEEFGEEQRTRCIEDLKAAVQHLRKLELAHNDINPSNVMLTDDGKFVLLNFDVCSPLGTKLVGGGQVGGFQNGVPVATRFESSSAECDNAAIEYLEDWLQGKNRGEKIVWSSSKGIFEPYECLQDASGKYTWQRKET